MAAGIIKLNDPAVLARSRDRGGAAGAPSSATTVRFPLIVYSTSLRALLYFLPHTLSP